MPLLKIKSKIKLKPEKMYNHFSTIASKYQSVRTLDIKPILTYKRKISTKRKNQNGRCGMWGWTLFFRVIEII